MTLRKWFHLFWTTLVLGSASSIIMGLILQFSDKEFSVMGISGVGFNVFNMLLCGALISVFSQMGFFAYLIVRFIAVGFVRSKRIFELIQIAVIIFVLFELIFLRITNSKTSETMISYFILPIVLIIISLAVSYWKAKLTNQNAFVPTLFFMFAVTVLEAVPALKLDIAASTIFMLAPLLVSNAWQILTLHKILDNKKS
ncbi:KinB signaling pathway activation protein [Paenibacillus sp. Soil766]|uniref:KinB-signaling pathway activation protein n=1 Tax=Paenibacillus sp. Soil766 TaxID=1736404 RepID=UPI00070B4003|nr:KinB-signaling pathway activation protein [Paenibacillus sp. Soil766]KRE93807.1 KinB signaling pathway activation protein [Paenibacillus sp. Soil766]